MIFVLAFLNFAFGTRSNGVCLDSRRLVLGLRVQSTSVFCFLPSFPPLQYTRDAGKSSVITRLTTVRSDLLLIFNKKRLRD